MTHKIQVQKLNLRKFPKIHVRSHAIRESANKPADELIGSLEFNKNAADATQKHLLRLNTKVYVTDIKNPNIHIKATMFQITFQQLIKLKKVQKQNLSLKK